MSKRGKMKLQINIEERYFVVIVAVFLVLSAGVVFVIAQQQPQYIQNPGHAIECISGSFGQSGTSNQGDRVYSPSTTGDPYTFNQVFEHISGSPPKVGCKDGWVVTGCSGTCQGSSTDYDLILEENACKLGDENCNGGVTVYTRCCRVVG